MVHNYSALAVHFLSALDKWQKEFLLTATEYLEQASKDAIASARTGVEQAAAAFNQASTDLNKSLSGLHTWIQENSTTALVQIHEVRISTRLSALQGSSFAASVDLSLMGAKQPSFDVTLNPNDVNGFVNSVVSQITSSLKSWY